jgi:branched-chain amino acid transport system permease protein
MSRLSAFASRKSAILAAIAVVVILAAPLVMPNDFIVKLFVFAGIATLVAAGINLIFGYAGQISLGHAAFYGIGAYTAAILSTRFGAPPLVDILAAAVAAALAACVIGIPALRLRGHYLAMATLGFNEIVAIVLVQAKPLTQGTDGISGIPPVSVLGATATTNIANYYVVWMVVLVALLITRNLMKSRVGRGIRALHASEVAAGASAVPTGAYKTRVFILSAVYAGVAGALYAHFVSFISPEAFSTAASVSLLTMVVVGGMGALWGPVLGGLVLTLGPEYLRAYQDWTLVLFGALLIAVMIFRPGGLSSLAGLLDSARRPGAREGAA